MFRPSFLVALNNLPKGQIIKGVEIGTMEGINAANMLNACDRLTLVCVDIVKQPKAVEALAPHADRVNYIIKPSVETAKDFPDNHFDYVYIDGAHDEKNVYADMVAWFPKLRLGGVFSGHDWWYSGVRAGVRKFFTTEKFQYIYGVQHYSEQAIPAAYAAFMDWWFIKAGHKKEQNEKSREKTFYI